MSFNYTCEPAKDSDFDYQSWVIAVIMAIVAAILNNIGVNLQKLSWTTMQENEANKTIYITYWVIGMVIISLASLCDFGALAFGPQSIIAPLGSLTMVTNAFVAHLVHGEKLKRNVVTSTVVILIGCIVSVYAASHTNEICSIAALFHLYKTLRFFVYSLITVIVLVGFSFNIKRMENIEMIYGNDSLEYQDIFKTHRFSYAALSGIFGAQSVLFAKSVDQLLVSSIRGNGMFLVYPGTYLVTVCMIASIVLQIYWLNQGLSRFESLYNVPVFTSTWIVFTSVAGGVMYGEFSNFSLEQAIGFPFGIFLCCLGVFFLSQEDKG